LIPAATKSLGDGVEIRIRDNGNWDSAEVREKMFNPFFTTKPAGEGTGLGLSISHDIIVKQHSGSIEVDTIHRIHDRPATGREVGGACSTPGSGVTPGTAADFACGQN
jgi:signal transduction histidine kinase